MASTVLIVEDDPHAVQLVRLYLNHDGHNVLSASNGIDGLQLAREASPDLVVLDLMLPGLDGLEVCRKVREESAVPIIILTARVEEEDRLAGLNLGADDYVTKPFSAREVVARVKATLRRMDMGKEQAGKAPKLQCGRLVLDPEQAEVTKDGVSLNLTYREFALLHYFLIHPGHVFSRERLLDKVWGYDYAGDERTVDVTIRRIREKIEDDPAAPVYICTRRGLGYYLRRP
jgi:two-component system, OmpR family, response regulator VicR